MPDDNEYLTRVLKVQGAAITFGGRNGQFPVLDKMTRIFRRRHHYIRTFGFAIPCEEALRVIAIQSPILEIGAGAGYWACLLRQRGVDILAYDPYPYGMNHENSWQWKIEWTEVLRGDHNVVKQHPDRTLLMIWPSYAESWAYKAIKAYKGPRVIYIGEGCFGCTGDEKFHNELERRWECIRTVQLPQWWSIHDNMHVYKRKGR